MSVSPQPSELFKFFKSKLGTYLLWSLEILSRDEKKFALAKGIESICKFSLTISGVVSCLMVLITSILSLPTSCLVETLSATGLLSEAKEFYNCTFQPIEELFSVFPLPENFLSSFGVNLSQNIIPQSVEGQPNQDYPLCAFMCYKALLILQNFAAGMNGR